MERFTHSIKVLWRSERLLVANDLRQGAQKIQFNALAGLVAVFGLVMLGLASFFALVPYMGQALAALTVAGIDLLIAVGLMAYARSLKPAPEYDMVREMRNTALNDIEEEVAQTGAELEAMKNDVKKFVRHPVEALVPGVGPIVNAIVRGVVSARK